MDLVQSAIMIVREVPFHMRGAASNQEANKQESIVNRQPTVFDILFNQQSISKPTTHFLVRERDTDPVPDVQCPSKVKNQDVKTSPFKYLMQACADAGVPREATCPSGSSVIQFARCLFSLGIMIIINVCLVQLRRPRCFINLSSVMCCCSS